MLVYCYKELVILFYVFMFFHLFLLDFNLADAFLIFEYRHWMLYHYENMQMLYNNKKTTRRTYWVY